MASVGLVTAEQISGSDLAFKKFIHELQTLVGVVGCTVFLLSSGKSDDIVRPEHTMVDGILELQDELDEMRAHRLAQTRVVGHEQRLGHAEGRDARLATRGQQTDQRDAIAQRFPHRRG